MNRRVVLHLSAAAALVAVGFGSPVFAQTKMVMKATDVHPLGYPTVEAVVQMGKKLEAATSGRLPARVHTVVPLDQVADAHRAVAKGGVRGRYVLEP